MTDLMDEPDDPTDRFDNPEHERLDARFQSSSPHHRAILEAARDMTIEAAEGARWMSAIAKEAEDVMRYVNPYLSKPDPALSYDEFMHDLASLAFCGHRALGHLSAFLGSLNRLRFHAGKSIDDEKGELVVFLTRDDC